MNHRRSNMPIIKFKNNNVTESFNFPLTFQEVETFFTHGTIELLENNNLPWLKQFNNQTISIYELNTFSRIYSELSLTDARKLDAICVINPNKSFNELHQIVQHLNRYGLINSFEDYSDYQALAMELSNQKYLQDIFVDDKQPIDDQDWIKLGKKARDKIPHQLTEYGWLFILSDELPELNENEVMFTNVRRIHSSVNIEAKSTNTDKFIVLPVYENIQLLREQLHRISDSKLLDLEIKYINLEMDNDLWTHISPILDKSHVLKSIELLCELNELDEPEIKTLSLILEHFETNDLNQLELILDNLYEFELLESRGHSPEEYALKRMNDLQHSDFETYQHWVENFLDYRKIGKAMLKIECVIETNRGYLRVPEELEHLVEIDQSMKDHSL